MILSILLAIPLGLNAEVLQIASDVGHYSLGRHLMILEDKTGTIPEEEIISGKHDGQFVQSPAENPNKGTSNSVYWTKVSVALDSSDSEWYLEIEYPHIDSVHTYIVRAGGSSVDRIVNGKALPFEKREMGQRTLVNSLTLRRGEFTTIYSRFQSTSVMILSSSLWRPARFAEHATKESYKNGAYVGLVAIMALYNFFLLLTNREAAYAWYSLYITSFGCFLMSTYGVAQEFTAPTLKPLVDRPAIFVGVTITMVGLFTQSFLSTKTSIPKMHPWLTLLNIISALMTVLNFVVSYSTGIKLTSVVVLAFFPILISAAVYCMIRGFRPARFYLASFFFLLLGTIMFGLRNLGIVPHSFLTYNGVQVGSALEVILLSLALADRMNLMKKDKESAQRDALEKQITLAKSYARFVPEQFMNLLGRNSITDVFLGDAVQKEMTVLFSDIRSFTTLSESMTPSENFQFLNSMLTRIGPVIRQHNGFIDKYIGDAIMALFTGSPEDAVKSAITMRQLLAVFNQRRIDKGFQPIKIGVGINTGNLILGTIGEPQRMEGTVIADAVNLASRLESLTKFYEATILISEQTLFRLPDPSQYNYRVLDRVKVKGKSESVTVVEIFDGDRDETVRLKQASRPSFEHGIHAYLNQDFAGAIRLMQDVLALNPDDRAAQLYEKRARYYAEHGVPLGWDAVETFQEK